MTDVLLALNMYMNILYVAGFVLWAIFAWLFSNILLKFKKDYYVLPRIGAILLLVDPIRRMYSYFFVIQSMTESSYLFYSLRAIGLFADLVAVCLIFASAFLLCFGHRLGKK